ncbi:MAG: PAS domain S-box protein [Bacteroidales bacterium]
MKIKPSETAAFFRQKAEALLQKKPAEKIIQLSEYETQKLFHEFEVQQLELENQLDELQKAKESLIISEKRYQSLFMKAGEGIFIMNLNGDLLEVNEAFAHMHGYTVAEMLNINIKNLDAPETASLMPDRMNQILKGNPLTFEVDHYHKDGHIVHLETSVSLITYNGITLIQSFHRDISERKKADEAIRESEGKYRYMFANNPQPMLIYDLETLAFLEVNDACIDLYGYSKEEILKKTLKDIHIEEDIPLLFKDIDIARTELNPGGEWRNIKKNGDIIFVDITSHTVNYKGRKARHILISDITLRKKSVESILMLAHAIRSISECVSITDNTDKIIFVNEAFLKTYQYEESEVLGKSIDMLRSPNSSSLGVENILSATLSGGWQGEILNCRKDGSEFPVFLSTSIVQNDKCEPLALIGIAKDISSRKQSETEIKQKNEELLKLNAEKDKYFSIIAHDLRSPFNSFLGLTQIMAEELQNLTMEEIQKFAVSMRNSATNLFRLLENLLEWSRIQQGLIPFRPNKVQLLPIIYESIEMILELAENKNIKIVYAVSNELEVFADSNILQTIVRNLVSNAVKFTPKNGNILIAAKATNDNSCLISIKDDGIGMDPKRKDNLFRMDINTSRNGTEGETSTGLGLIICKDFIEKHGGKLWLESEVNQGSTFYFRLPYPVTLPEKNVTEILMQTEKTKKKKDDLKILIAEDDEVSEMLITMMVKKFCAMVFKAKNGSLALKALELHPDIDVILMDIQMPEMNGIEACLRIREFNKEVIIIAQTAFTQSGEKEQALAAGCNEFIIKPLKEEELKEKIFRLLKIKN